MHLRLLSLYTMPAKILKPHLGLLEYPSNNLQRNLSASNFLFQIPMQDFALTPSKQGPALGLLAALHTLLVLALWERAETFLVKGNTQALGSCRRSFRVLRCALVRPVPYQLDKERACY